QSLPAQPNVKAFSSTCTLTVNCVAQADLRFTPGKINFGMVPIGQTPQMALDIEKFNDPSWQILEIVKNDLPLEASLNKYEGRGRNMYRVVVELKPNAPAGEFKHELQLKTSGGNLLSMVAEGIIQAPIAVSPN